MLKFSLRELHYFILTTYLTTAVHWAILPNSSLTLPSFKKRTDQVHNYQDRPKEPHCCIQGTSMESFDTFCHSVHASFSLMTHKGETGRLREDKLCDWQTRTYFCKIKVTKIKIRKKHWKNLNVLAIFQSSYFFLQPFPCIFCSLLNFITERREVKRI